MLGSVFDADDAVQETMVRAWRGLQRFEARAELRTWLYRIATNVCLDFLAERKRRTRPSAEGAAGTADQRLVLREREHWVEPMLEACITPVEADPHERAALNEHTRLAFIVALQELPPRQRAALLLAEVVGCTPSEIAEQLGTTAAAVNSALQRARATLAGLGPAEPTALGDDPKAQLLERYLAAFERFDVDELVGLLREDATFSMPPYTLWLRGPTEIRRWLHGPGSICRGSRLVPLAAFGQPAFAQYHAAADGWHRAWGLLMLELVDERIVSWTTFLDVDALFPRFGIPMMLS